MTSKVTEGSALDDIFVKPFSQCYQSPAYMLWFSGWDDTLRQYVDRTWRGTTTLSLLSGSQFTLAAIAYRRLIPQRVALALSSLTLVSWGFLMRPVLLRMARHKAMKIWIPKYAPDMVDIQTSWVDRADRGFWVALQAQPMSAPNPNECMPPDARDASSAHLVLQQPSPDVVDSSVCAAPAKQDDMNGAATARVVGCVAAQFGAVDPPPCSYKAQLTAQDCLVFRLSADPRVRRRGVGSALMRAVEDEARRRGCTRVLLETGNAVAITFYQRLGYSQLGADRTGLLAKAL